MEDVEGVSQADLDLDNRRTTVIYDPAVIDRARIEALIGEAGYPVRD